MIQFNNLIKEKQTTVSFDGVDYKVKYASTPSEACSKCSLRYAVHCGHSLDCMPFDVAYKEYSYFDEIEKKENEEDKSIWGKLLNSKNI